MTDPTRRDLANALRMLAVDAVQKANSGHPGMPMGMAEIAEVVFRHHLRHNPGNPKWPNRDRFVLSNGHGSMLLYGLLYLSGYDLSLDDLMAFRQLESRTPGHPEVGVTPGVETTTGPLGQGLANAVGMALAERLLSATFNRPGFEIVDHRTYAFVGDGCLMEGISHEACSLAGTLALGKLIVIYDANGISIDGEVRGWFTDDTPKRFAAYGWRVIDDVDGHDFEAIEKALAEAERTDGRPTLVVAKTVIGRGSPNKQGKESCHGAPLGEKEVVLVREQLGWVFDAFEIPLEIRAAWDARERGRALETEWRALFARYQTAYPEFASAFVRRLEGAMPEAWAEEKRRIVASAVERAEAIPTRRASQKVIEAMGGLFPELIGGSADLTHSNLTIGSRSKVIDHHGDGNYLHFGVREFGMSAIATGLALHGGFIPYVGTFLVFSDYARNALRMAALMKQRVVFVFTHDSIGLGEDGPTHQPIEHAATLRLIPNMDVWRPCDAVETATAWISAIDRKTGPTSLLLSRQNLPHFERSPRQVEAIRRGGYVLAEAARGRPAVVIIATGSEVSIALEARAELESSGVPTRIVSMPSTSVFDRQDAEWREEVLPMGVPRLAVEAGVGDIWRKYVGLEGAIVGLDRFGESAPADVLFEHFGLTAENVAQAARRVLL